MNKYNKGCLGEINTIAVIRVVKGEPTYLKMFQILVLILV